MEAGALEAAELAAVQAEVAEAEAELAEAQQAVLETTQRWEEERQALERSFAKAASEPTAHLDELHPLRSGQHAGSAAIVAIDPRGAVVEWNTRATEVFGFDALAQGPGRYQLAECLPQIVRQPFKELEAELITAANVVRGSDRLLQCNRGILERHVRLEPRDMPARQADGRHADPVPLVSFWNELSVLALSQFDEAGRLDSILFVVQDTSDYCQEQREAEVVVEELTRLIHTFNAPIIAVDLQGRIDEWNRKAERLTGYSNEEAMGKRFVQTFVTEESADSVQTMLSLGLVGQDIMNFTFTLFTADGQRREVLWNATARRDGDGKVDGVIGIGQDITELRSESKMLANYVRICGAAVWSLRGNAKTGVVTDSKTKEIEHLIAQQAHMDICDPRMVVWRASFVSILKTMCQTFWMRRKSGEQSSREKSAAGGAEQQRTLTTDFGYEFCFEAPNGSVKWYKVQGHLIQEFLRDCQFEVTGSMQEVTSMLIDKVEGQRWQKWWNRMCHMVFDATLLVDTQEYRVLNAWGEEKVFGCQLQAHHPLLQLIKAEDTNSLKEAFNEVTFKGFEGGRTLHLLRPGRDKHMPAQCFLLSADQENPNECMMGIRMQVSNPTDDDVPVLWDVAKPHPVLTLEDLARLKSGLKRLHRRPTRKVPAGVHRPTRPIRSTDPHQSSHSLSSIPEDLHGEDDEFCASDRGGDNSDPNFDTESMQSSSKSSTSSKSSNQSISEVGVCNSSPARSAVEDPGSRSREGHDGGAEDSPSGVGARLAPRRSKPRVVQVKSPDRSPSPAPARRAPPRVKLRWLRQTWELSLDNFSGISELRTHIAELTGVPASRQTLILAGEKLPNEGAEADAGSLWSRVLNNIHPGQTLMVVGSKPSGAPPKEAGGAPGQPAVAASPGAEATTSQRADGKVRRVTIQE